MKNMRQACRVLLWVAEQPDEVTVEQVAEGVGIAFDQARASLRQLRIKQKLIATDGRNNKSYYRYNENYEPPQRAKVVKCSSRVAKAREAKLPVAYASLFKFADKKIELLTRLKSKCIDSDADIIEGMINDYNSVNVKEPVKMIRR